jgi:hypothetical protein
MQKQKGFIIPLIIAIVAVLTVGGGLYLKNTANNFPCWPPFCFPGRLAPISTSTNPIIGGDKDEHGCLGPAGYSWCEIKNKCLRVLEEKCESITNNNIPTFTEKDLENGWYYGNLDQKKLGTPSNWVHIGDGTRSASWSAPKNNSCIPNWQCGWGACSNGYQGMTAVDSNNCGLSSTGVNIMCPALARECSSQ